MNGKLKIIVRTNEIMFFNDKYNEWNELFTNDKRIKWKNWMRLSLNTNLVKRFCFFDV